MISFVIPTMAWEDPDTGKFWVGIDGYYVQGARPNWKRRERYVAWKQHVQECAVLAGMELPLRATRDRPMYVITEAFFASGTHVDPENAHKGVVDALCYVSPTERKLGVKKGSDKYVGGLFFAPRYDREEPRVQVTVLTEAEAEFEVARIDRILEEENGE